jgi:hypothetical protein
MASAKQKAAAKKNVRKAANVAKKKRTIAHLPRRPAPHLASRHRKWLAKKDRATSTKERIPAQSSAVALSI